MILTTMLIPFLLLLLIPLGFVLKFGKVTRKVTHWLLFSYIGILILAAASIPFITVSDQTLEKVELDSDAWGSLFDDLRVGQLDSPLAQPFLVKQSELDLGQKDLLQLISEGEDRSFNVLLERKEENDNKLEVFLFQGKFIMNGYDFSFKLEPRHYALHDHTDGKALRFAALNQTIKLALTLPEFTIRQFTEEEKWVGSEHWHRADNQIIYLRVPHDLEVIADEDDFPFIEYVQK
ncbi:hypothetical protein BEP19_12155 [Ammoniphilus oxalaticus]|uniref:Uncharacterized protein n=1 Tax=Ammoniphilus oxalaticus TaxID=66863 RepID=A0A419SGR2_9BACL|nr:hypothetical protein [Ammoniphilus oxalaticus]RKD22977.1 hypothetical protein BEP19_12155 [Ammoniphilus oxalaticus]